MPNRELLPFAGTEWQCPKCRGVISTIRYKIGGCGSLSECYWYYDPTDKYTFEHHHRYCQTCGYQQIEAIAPAPATEEVK